MEDQAQERYIAMLKRHHHEMAVIGAARSAKAAGRAIHFDADMLWVMTTFQVVALNAPDGEWLRAAGEEAGVDVTKLAQEIYLLQWEFNYTIRVKLGLERAPAQMKGIRRFLATDSHAPNWVLVSLYVSIAILAVFWSSNFLR